MHTPLDIKNTPNCQPHPWHPSVIYVAEGWKKFKTIETIKEQKPSTIPQDVNRDGVVDTQDVLDIYKYIQEH